MPWEDIQSPTRHRRNYVSHSKSDPSRNVFPAITYYDSYRVSIPVSRFRCLRFLDCAMSVPFSFVNVGFIYGAYIIHKHRPLVAVAIVIGAIATWTTYSYPINLLFDSHWLECIMTHRYPMEDIALVTYVYVPATLCFSAMLFGAT